MTDQDFAALDQLIQAAIAGNERIFDALDEDDIDRWGAERHKRGLVKSMSPKVNAAAALRGVALIRAALNGTQ